MGQKAIRRALVAGGAGFIGANLCARLLKDGYHVTCMDDLSTGNVFNLLPLQSSENFHFYRQNTRQPLNITVDVIFNLTGGGWAYRHPADPLQTILANSEGTLNLLKLAQCNDAVLVKASSSGFYDDVTLRDDITQSPRCGGAVREPTAFSRRDVNGIKIAGMDFQTNVRVTRIFGGYGPYMRNDGCLVSDLIVQALRNRPITIHGDGNRTCSFCYVDDLIAGIQALAEARSDCAGPVNLGNPAAITVTDLARQIVEISGSSSRIVHNPVPVHEPAQRPPNIERARRFLNWQPQISLNKGLADTIDYFERLLTRETDGAINFEEPAQTEIPPCPPVRNYYR